MRHAQRRQTFGRSMGRGRLRTHERPRKGPLGVVLERLFVRANEPRRKDRADHRGDERRDADGPRVVFKRAAEPEATEAKNRRPDDSARGVIEKELFPIETVDAGEEGGEGAQHRDEPAEEYDLAAMLEKEILPKLQPPLVQADIAPVSI